MAAPLVHALEPLGARPRWRVLWIELQGSPAAVDLVGDAHAIDRPYTATSTDGWGGARRGCTWTPSPFVPCGALSDALACFALRGARPLPVLPAVPRAAIRPTAIEPAEAVGGFRAGRRWIDCVDRRDWGRLRGLPARAAQLDAELSALLHSVAGPTAVLLAVRRTRAPYGARSGQRELLGDRPALVALESGGTLVEPGESHNLDGWRRVLAGRIGLRPVARPSDRDSWP